MRNKGTLYGASNFVQVTFLINILNHRFAASDSHRVLAPVWPEKVAQKVSTNVTFLLSC